MEKRQLDFNAPFLSVRRYSSPSKKSSELVKHKVTEKPLPCRQQSLPPNKSDWESEEVVKPAAVPFHWEQIPGRPKGQVESPARTPDESSSTPRLPPGRLSDAIRRNSGPSRYNSGEHNIYRPQIEAYDHESLLEKLNESLNCKDESGSESGEDAYSDALDTLSGSWSFNYSVSGLSGDSGTFAIDTQTRDFMMNRFLPAAKAVVLETPKYVVKKPTVLNEEPKEVKKVIKSGEIKPLYKQYGSGALPYNSHYTDDVESEDEDEERRVPVKKPGKAWGILRIPRFCVKKSMCLLNPLPSMKSKPRPPTPPIGEAKRLRRNAHSGPLDKNACHVPHKIKFHSGLLSRDLPQIATKLTNDSNQFLNSGDSFKSGLSPLRHHSHRSGSISPYRNESPKSPFREGVGFLGVPKEVENYNANKIASSRKMFKALQDVSKNQINERVPSGPPNDSVETTLFIDSVTKTNFPISKSSAKAVSRQINNLDKESSRQLDCSELVPYDPPMKSPLPPPLPKSPSESWLWRTMPLGNPFSQSRSTSPLRSRKQGQIGSITETKWETIVKTSNLRPDHVRYSEELIPHASYRQRKS
ncbi:hypothetical protein BUALT_Bualt03G0045000 [Buddleja alternifolia]|uniref:Uncharacterized protein n=1 Tax=Buddleja alternifolia TaxID=168488 RepID=A0AAV6Y1W8_9LAMI|nr:hypothetical protein BUALT_Bualt03G0045000 [Buddleja alternifolia]